MLLITKGILRESNRVAFISILIVRVTLVPYGLTKRSCYVIAACSEKERPDSFTHSKKVHLNLLQISPRSAQYNGRTGARKPRLTSPNASLTYALSSRGGRVDASASRA